jgi:hypothetical protein
LASPVSYYYCSVALWRDFSNILWDTARRAADQSAKFWDSINQQFLDLRALVDQARVMPR